MPDFVQTIPFLLFLFPVNPPSASGSLPIMEMGFAKMGVKGKGLQYSLDHSNPPALVGFTDSSSSHNLKVTQTFPLLLLEPSFGAFYHLGSHSRVGRTHFTELGVREWCLGLLCLCPWLALSPWAKYYSLMGLDTETDLQSVS